MANRRFPGFEAYVGCAVTDAPPAFLGIVTDFKRELDEKTCPVLDFLDKGMRPLGTTVLAHCLGHVRRCKIMIAVCDHRSFGLGIEAWEFLKRENPAPLVMLHRQDVQISQMALDLQTISADVSVHSYEDLRTDGVEIAAKLISDIAACQRYVGPSTPYVQTELFSDSQGREVVAA